MDNPTVSFSLQKKEVLSILKPLTILQMGGTESEIPTIVGLVRVNGDTVLTVSIFGKRQIAQMKVPVVEKSGGDSELFAAFKPMTITREVTKLVDGEITFDIIRRDGNLVEVVLTDALGFSYTVTGVSAPRPELPGCDNRTGTSVNVYDLTKAATKVILNIRDTPTDVFGSITSITCRESDVTILSGDQISLQSVSIRKFIPERKDVSDSTFSVTVPSSLFMIGTKVLLLTSGRNFPDKAPVFGSDRKLVCLSVTDQYVVLENQHMIWYCEKASTPFPETMFLWSQNKPMTAYGIATLLPDEVKKLRELLAIGQPGSGDDKTTIRFSLEDKSVSVGEFKFEAIVNGNGKEITVSRNRLDKFLSRTKDTVIVIYREFPLQPVNVIEPSTNYEVFLAQTIPA